jgi:transposase
VARLLETARTSVALKTAAPARRAEIHRLLARWDLLRRQLHEIDTRLALLVEHHPAARALTTVPGVSVVCAATLVAELGTPETYESHARS